MEDNLCLEEISEKDVLTYVNELLQKCGIEFSIEDVSECKSDLFLALYNAIIGDLPPGALVDCCAKEVQVHNIGCIVTTLGEDYLKVDLSHISSSKVIDGDLMSIYNLVEILDGMLDYLLEKITSESDSGDDGDVDSDQLSDKAKAIAMETIQRVISQGDKSEEPSLSDTAELIALGSATFIKDPAEGNEFSLLKPEISRSADGSEVESLSDHTLITDDSSEKSGIHHTDFSGVPSPPDSFHPLPTELSRISSTLSKLKVDLDDVPTRLIMDDDGKVPRPSSSSSSSTIVVSDSGTSLDSERRRKALEVEVDETQNSFSLKKQERSNQDSIDVPDGGGGGGRETSGSANDTTFKDSYRQSGPPTPKARDWQAMLDNLQRTVEESRRIRDEYFSSFHSSRSQNDTLTDSQMGPNDIVTTQDAINESTHEDQRQHKKNVRFEDTISTKTAKELAQFRQLLKQEKTLQDHKNKILSRSYKDHLDEVRAAEDEKLDPLRRKVSKGGKQVKASMQKKKLKTKAGRNMTDAAKLSWLSPSRTHPPRQRRVKPTTPKQVDIDPALDNNLESINEHDLLPKLLQEFPQLELPPAILNEMWQKQFRQIEHLTKATYDHRNKKRRSEMQLQQSHMKHDLLTKIMQKEHDHTRRLRDVRERVSKQKEAQKMLRDRRLQAARVRKYYKDYHLQMKSRMMKRRTKEEKIFRRLFEDGLDIQRARLREIRRYARDKREEQQKRQRDEIQSLENYYRDQFDILAETLAKERNDLKVRDEAQMKLVRQMKRGLRQKMEQEIQNLQDMITRDDDETHFREIEADRLRRQLQLATYHAKFND